MANTTNELVIVVENLPSIHVGTPGNQSSSQTYLQKDNQTQKSSYSLILLLVLANLTAAICSAIMLQLQEGSIKSIVKYIYLISIKLSLHVIPLAWILTMRPVKDFVFHKLKGGLQRNQNSLFYDGIGDDQKK